jgi:putative oxygen-independent coproporphyrinogen III oxidase
MRSAIAPARSSSSSQPASLGPSDDGAGFGVYAHWPFCASKCPYCDFNSHVRTGGIDEPRFLAAFLRELAHMAALAPDREVSSIFFGGGTPSLMQPSTTGAILDAIASHWIVRSGAEITLEANPSSVEAERFRGYRSAGVNRVSLGVQALNDPDLRALGRLHSVAEARAAVSVARTTFDRYSFDLIYARPRQTLAAWRDELRDAIAMADRHLSLYQLTIEAGTPFAGLHAAGKLKIPDPELADALYETTQEMMEAAGLPAYEISNHAAPGEESRHNLVYWRYGEYAGIGPGAHGRLSVDGERHALVTERQPERWLDHVERNGHGLVESDPLSSSEQADEMLLMGLRLTEGIDLARLAAIGGTRPDVRTIRELANLGLLEELGQDRLRATAHGRFVLNTLVLKLSSSLMAERT